ncbi:MAG TPA: bifunctional adenosylcobinamide kinase/adenosylcobinamide-phosphate guanylyltransferase [Streptosporangiaceae bacterium]
MYARLIGTGGAAGWPADDCRCASCMRARTAGQHRRPGRVLVDGILEFGAGQPTRLGTGPVTVPGYHVIQLPGGLDITGPDGGRLLLAAGPGEVPQPPPGAAPYDLALLDLLASPRQLGRLRADGFVAEHTAVAALYTDDRVSSGEEMARRCAVWRAVAAVDGQVISRDDAATAGLPVQRPHRTLVMGGARSGKSAEAELRLAGEAEVTYLAAGPWPGDWTSTDGEPDAEWAQRVAAHRAGRPTWWQTVETLDVAGQLRARTGALLLDGVGTWLAAVMDEAGMWTGRADATAVVQARIDDLADAWRQTRALLVAVTDQVGAGLVPAYRAGRVFRDQLGWLNQRLATESEVNLLVEAGRVMKLPG